MPIGYDTKCNGCGEQSSIPHSYMSLRHDGRVIPLPHPAETTYIQKYGYTKLQATVEGRLRDNNAYICGPCKEIFFKPSLILPRDMPPNQKSQILLWIFITPIMGYMVFSNISNWIIAAIFVPIAVIYALVVSKIEKRLIQQRLLAEHSIPDIQGCPNCSSDQITRLSDLGLSDGDKLPVKCSACSGDDIVITWTWLS